MIFELLVFNFYHFFVNQNQANREFYLLLSKDCDCRAYVRNRVENFSRSIRPKLSGFMTPLCYHSKVFET